MKQILWVLTCLLCGVYITQPISDPDLFWHLNIGNWITSHRLLPTHDFWVEGGAGHVFRAYSWLFESIISLVYRVHGFQFLIVSECILGASLVAIFAYVFSKLSKDNFSGLLLGVLCSGGIVAHFSLRPQSITWGIFALVLFMCSRECQLSYKQKYFSLFLFLMIWANLHISTVIGIAVVFFLFHGTLHQRAVAGVISFMGTLVTPYVGGEWLTFIGKLSHPADFSIIDEFKAARFIDVPSIILIIVTALLLSVLVEQRRLLSKEKIVVGIALLGMGVSVVKFMPYTIIYFTYLVSDNLDNASGSFTEGVKRLAHLFEKYLSGQGLAVVLLAITFLKISSLLEMPIQRNIFPEEEIKYFKDKNLPLPLLSGFNEGGYVSFSTSDSDGNPPFRVIMDGRTNLISKELWSDYVDSLKGNQNSLKIIDRTHPGTVLWRSDAPLVQILKREGFCEVMQKKYSLLVKQEYANKAGLACVD